MNSDEHDREATQVTGPPVGLTGPGYGQEFSGRYELGTCLEQDVFTFTYEGYDVVSSERVLIRVVRPGLLKDAAQTEMVAKRLREIVGVGGAHLTPLLDAGFEGPWVYTVEPPAQGASLRSVLDSRLATGRHMEFMELLPVIARIDAGLKAIPPPWSHGDIRAERIYFTTDSLKLTGAFLTPALPPSALSEALADDRKLRQRRAPDASRGSGGDSADRFGVGSLAYECLVGRLPEGADAALPARLQQVGQEIASLLVSDPSKRSPSLQRMISVLAESCGSTVPKIEPQAYRRPRRSSVPRIPRRAAAAARENSFAGGAADLDGEATKRVARAKVIEGAASGGTQEISLDQILEEFESTADGISLSDERSPTRTRDAGPPSSTQEVALDQILSEEKLSQQDTLVTEALDATKPSASTQDPLRNLADRRARESGLDPRLVRAALATVEPVVTKDLLQEEEDEEVTTSDDEFVLADTAPRNTSQTTAPKVPIVAVVSPPKSDAPLTASAQAAIGEEIGGPPSGGNVDTPARQATRVTSPLSLPPPRLTPSPPAQIEPLRLILIAILLGLIILGGSLMLRDSWDSPYELINNTDSHSSD